MNKSIFSMVLVAVLGICSLNAGETISQKPTTGLQKQDMEMLFGANANSVNVAVLSEEEMKEIKGEFWVALGANILIGLGAYGICGIVNGFKNCDLDIPETKGRIPLF
ncbi:hypothetical protein ACWIWK_03765 [Helicobacter sp. 23-1048]